jgi:hypothetical protein
MGLKGLANNILGFDQDPRVMGPFTNALGPLTKTLRHCYP